MYSLDLNPYGVHQKIIESVPVPSRVLEIGCASGYLLENLRIKGSEVIGIEADETAATLGRRKKIPIIVGDFEDQKVYKKLKNRRFDVIIAADVLEHSQYPERVIRLFLPYLAEHGKIIISVPNIAFLSNRLSHLLGKFTYTPYGIMDKTHVRFFTRESITTLLRESGLDIKTVVYIGNFTQLPLYMNTVHPFVRKWPHLKIIEQTITQLWPEGLAVQFLIYAKKNNV